MDDLVIIYYQLFLHEEKSFQKQENRGKLNFNESQLLTWEHFKKKNKSQKKMS